jgi:hypothetical protein
MYQRQSATRAAARSAAATHCSAIVSAGPSASANEPCAWSPNRSPCSWTGNGRNSCATRLMVTESRASTWFLAERANDQPLSVVRLETAASQVKLATSEML